MTKILAYIVVGDYNTIIIIHVIREPWGRICSQNRPPNTPLTSSFALYIIPQFKFDRICCLKLKNKFSQLNMYLYVQIIILIEPAWLYTRRNEPLFSKYKILLKVSSGISTKLELWVIPYNLEIIIIFTKVIFQYLSCVLLSRNITWFNRGRLPIDIPSVLEGEGSYYGARQNVGQTW